MLIDVHAHGFSEELVRRMADTPGLGFPLQATGPRSYHLPGYGTFDPLLYDLDARLESLKRRGVALQLISPSPSIISNGAKVLSLEETRLLNASTAWMVANGEGRIAGLAVPALGDPAIAADELHRAVEQHGFSGVVLSTSAGPLTLDNPAFEPLFAVIETLDLMIFMHSTSSALSATQTEYTLRTLVAWPTETTVAVTRLIFAGVLERHPRLKLVLSHGGGTLPALAGRLDLGWSAPQYEANPACRANISRPPSTYLRSLYYDTVVASPGLLEFIIRTYGPDHVLFGTDFPYEIGDAEGDLALPMLAALPDADREMILSGNALRLLGGRAPRGA
ncbi:amidohydrolase family protein [Hyphomicrobium sp. CS1BSMeth3]|uniref:amidohydrolase family protein n=1 Tax=Hyphomicrobium sp. CS1BSMeth3 TaxID=1892844 RepID=UPI00092FF99F|nr:amidohydrolase family protein [Hyphomicrobium sp. CS1BSMeth3]